MPETTIAQLPDPSGFSTDPFTDIIRDGARKLIEQAIHAELAVLMAQARPVPNPELATLGPALDKPGRDKLNRLGLIASAIMLAFGLWWLARAERRARMAGEGFGELATPDAGMVAEDEIVRERAAVAQPFDPAEAAHGVQGSGLPSALVAFAPLAVVIGVNLLMSLLILPRMDVSYLQYARFGETSLSEVAGVWSVSVALAVPGAGQDAYLPASDLGTGLIDTALDDLGAGPALDPAAEAAALGLDPADTALALAGADGLAAAAGTLYGEFARA